MSTITPSRLKEVLNAETFRQLTADNFAILAEEIAKRVATHQNGSPTAIIGPPTSGDRVLNEFWRDALGGEWVCTAAGTPGTWLQTRAAAVVVDPSTGTIPTGYLIWNVTDGAVKRHAGAYSWEITVGGDAAAKVGFHGVTPTAQAAHIADPSGGTTVDAEARAAINTILVALEGKGVVAGS
ncbi:MAG: hypothetical protein H7A46_18815 [Verrucomicrobiales bacterium]|nr:hypothetical protein [Planctomycetota bacterium]MCP5523595.1 hypothetical protein [Verrucomicrobiales bacterium]